MNKISRHALAFGILLATFGSDVMAADDIAALKEELQALKQGQVQIQKDLEEIKKLLQKGGRKAPTRKAFAPADMKLGDVPSIGKSDAIVTLVEFSDYQCPFCRRHAKTVMPQLLESYIDTGKVRFVMREFPIQNLHSRAEAASVAALCAGDQGQYWGMHDALFNDQKANTNENFQDKAAGLELNVVAFAECMASDRHKAQIRADLIEGRKLGISGTPSFVLGLTDPADPSKVHLTKFLRGAQPLSAFATAIEDLLKSAEATK